MEILSYINDWGAILYVNILIWYCQLHVVARINYLKITIQTSLRGLIYIIHGWF